MMVELVKSKDTRLEEYEKLLTTRDSLRKEAALIYLAYIREFGHDILKVYKQKMECIRLKKTITYCQLMKNKNMVIDDSALQKYLEEEMRDYNLKLNAMIQEHNAANTSKMLSEAEILKIKRIYRKIAKKIHPDMNPTLEQNEKIKELWNRVVIAYECNNLEELEELELLVNNAIESEGINLDTIVIPNIEEKIEKVKKEVEVIQTTDPYLYKDILGNYEIIKEKKRSLKEEYDSYVDYAIQLQELLEAYRLERGGNGCLMN